MKIIQDPSPNFSKRKRSVINMIVIHCTAGLFPGAINWMKNPKSKVSAHYAISKKGVVTQLVQDDYVAWHAGRSEWEGEKGLNSVSIGIELEHLNTTKDQYTLLQLRALERLCALLKRKYDIPYDRILGHYHISPNRKTDPVGFPWDLFFHNLRFLLKPKKKKEVPRKEPFLFRFFYRIALFFKGD